MWFDARAKLAEIAEQTPATSATPATQAPAARPVSKTSQAPEVRKPAFRVATVAVVATPSCSEPDPVPPAGADGPNPDPAGFNYGTACDIGLYPRTWTGRVACLAEWHTLTDWERHGPHGRHWNAAKGRWEQPEGATS